MKIISVVGARPQFIKATMVSREVRKNHHEILLHTGQHYDDNMSQLFFDELSLPQPDYNLGIGSDTHSRQTGKMLVAIEEILLQERPDWVIVYGDTNSTLAGALASAKLDIPVAHVEAGLRAYNKAIPEEINRVVVDYVSSLLFAPTQTAVKNLRRESITEGVFNTGDVMYDAILKYKKVAEERSEIIKILNLKPKDFLVVTIHRAGTTDNPTRLNSVMKALSQINEQIIFPVHPRSRKALEVLQPPALKQGHTKLISPVGYLDMLTLVRSARLLITDSGGLQKEAYFLKTPCVTCLEEDEWPETIAAGANRLVGTNIEKIIEAVKKPYPPIKNADEFGDGQAAEKMVNLLENRSDIKKLVELRVPSQISFQPTPDTLINC